MTDPKEIYSGRSSAFSVLLLFFGLALIGFSLLPLLEVRLNPTRETPGIVVNYYWPDASARVIEQEVTSKLEAAFSSMNGLSSIYSESSRGSGQIRLALKKNTAQDLARFEVAMLIRRVYPGLPEGVSYPLLSLNTSGEKPQVLMTYTLSAPSTPLLIKEYADEILTPKLAATEGISELIISGSTPFEWRITLNSALLKETGISWQQVATAVNNYFRGDVLGIIDSGNGKEQMEMAVLLKTMQNHTDIWKQIPVARVGDRIIVLSDIARVRYQQQEADFYYRINALNTIYLTFYAGQGNTLRTGKKLQQAIENIRNELPAGYVLKLSYDSTEYIRNELAKIGHRSLWSVLILLLFILLITRQWRYLILISLSLILNLIIAVIFYYLAGLEIHLYSLAGITVSFGIIIDNSIVMIDHFHHYKNKNVFLAILAATLTTIGALSIVFLLGESQRLNLIDFAGVMFVDLIVSLFIALFFIPAYLEKMPLRIKRNGTFIRRKRRVVRFERFYTRQILFFKRFKWILFLIFILGFGIPVHLLPQKMENGQKGAALYNRTLGSTWMQNTARPVLEKVLGGSFRLFSLHVFEKDYYSEPERTKLYISAKMPEGCTVGQLNSAVVWMESFLLQYKEIEVFQTEITAYNNARITIFFKPEDESGSFPYLLKNEVIARAVSLGGVDWVVFGVGRAFNNALYEGYKNYRIKLEGYNYDQLYNFAVQLSDSLLKNPRIEETLISSDEKVLQEYFIHLDPRQLAEKGLYINDIFSSLKSSSFETSLQEVYDGNSLTAVTMVSDLAEGFNSWQMKNLPVGTDSALVKVRNLGNIGRQKSGNNIIKYDQQYLLNVSFDYIGSPKLALKIIDRNVAMMKTILPLGYKASSTYHGGWDRSEKKQYYLIFLVVAIIYFICSILLESFLQPLAIIAIIPLLFIGVFLTFYLFDINFDQGGFAAFVFLAGIGVNSGLYILNDYNQFVRGTKNLSMLKLYVKAFNHKIIPVILTILSTIIGLLPFVWGGQQEVFWFSFAAGVIGGLLFSLLSIYIYFPLFLNLKAGSVTR